MKRSLLALSFCFTVGSLLAQPAELIIKTDDSKPYLEHKVASKESFFSIGRLYNAHPRHIAAFNGIDMAKGLKLGQRVKIPLTDTNFTQEKGEGVPVYYVTKNKEELKNISEKNGMVNVEKLKNWNAINGNEAAKGKNVIIGFLITNEMKSMAVTIPDGNPADTKKESELKKTEPDVIKEPIVVKEEPQKVEPMLVNQDGRIVNTGSGYFKNDFDRQVRRSALTKEMTVTSGIFKTTSGWQDAKYYLLIDKVEPGTIVRITNPANNKIVYAKVLYGMEGIRQNQGLDIRISNAAASALEITDIEKFIVKVNY